MSSLTLRASAVLLAACTGCRTGGGSAGSTSAATAAGSPVAVATAPDAAAATAVGRAPAGPVRIGSVDQVAAMLLDDTNVYVLTGVAVVSIPKAGGGPQRLDVRGLQHMAEEIAPGVGPWMARSGTRILVTASDEVQQPSTPQATVYWFVDATVATVSTSGDAPFRLDTRDVEVRGAGADAMWFYWLESGRVSRIRPEELPLDRLVKMPVAGGATSVVARDLGRVLGFAVDATSAYVATLATGGRGRVLRLPLAGGASTVVASDLAWPDEQTTLALDDAYLYWTSGDRLVRVDKSAAGAATATVVSAFVPSRVGDESAYSLDDTYVYWTSKTGVQRARKDGSAPPELLVPAAPAEPPRAIAVDATNVFFTSGSAVLRLTK
jgi:hypothetical protein